MTKLKNKVLLFFICVVASTVFVPSLVYAQASSASPDVSDLGVATGDVSCTTPSHWKDSWNSAALKPWGQAWWHDNRCGLQLQERTVCKASPNYTRYSGIVKRVNLPAKEHCNAFNDLISVSVHWRNNSNSPWSPWHRSYYNNTPD